jgi:hypothetical protein
VCVFNILLVHTIRASISVRKCVLYANDMNELLLSQTGSKINYGVITVTIYKHHIREQVQIKLPYARACIVQGKYNNGEVILVIQLYWAHCNWKHKRRQTAVRMRSTIPPSLQRGSLKALTLLAIVTTG